MEFVLGDVFSRPGVSVLVPLTFSPVGLMLHPNCKACRLLRTLSNVRWLEPHTPVNSITLNSITIPFSSWALQCPLWHKHMHTLIRVINSVEQLRRGEGGGCAWQKLFRLQICIPLLTWKMPTKVWRRLPRGGSRSDDKPQSTSEDEMTPHEI